MKPLESERPATGAVTSTSVQVKDPNRMSIFVDGAFSFGMPLEAAMDLGIRKGVELDDALLDRCLAADRSYRARQKALNLLAHRQRSRGELRQRLRRAGFDDQAILEALARMEKLGYLNDPAFAEAFARDRMHGKKLGRRRVVAELGRKGISREMAEETVHRVSESRDELADAIELAARRSRALRSLEDPRKKRNRIYSHLVRKGYSGDIVGRALQWLEENAGTEGSE